MLVFRDYKGRDKEMRWEVNVEAFFDGGWSVLFSGCGFFEI
jgi:hypothetical protein